MKRIFALILPAFFAINSIGQELNNTVSAGYLKYNDLIAEKKFEESLDYTNKALFSFVARQDLLNMMEATMNNGDMQFTFHKPVL